MTSVSTAEQRRAEVIAELADHSLYDLVGGEATVRSLVDRFYDVMNDGSFGLIRDMHQADLSPMRLGLFEFLSGWLGGPPLFFERRGSVCLTGAHAPFPIDQAARDQWLACMDRAMDDVGIELKYREVMAPAFERIADMMRND